MSFESDIDAWAEKTEAKMRLAIQKIAIGAFSEVILMSPVDTGRFRGNWQVAIGHIPFGTIDLLDPTGSIVTQKMTEEAQKMGERINNYETIYLINNLPYARRLEYGWSKQAPGGMVRITVQRWQSICVQVAEQLRWQ